MHWNPNRLMAAGTSRAILAFACLLIFAMAPVAAQEVITLRSGNGAAYAQDTSITYTTYPALEPPFEAPPLTLADFSTALTGQHPTIWMNPIGPTVTSLPDDPLAHWIYGGAGPTLYAITFHVASPSAGIATLHLEIAANLYLGGNGNQGVYLNGDPLTGNTVGSGPNAVTVISRDDIAPLLHPGLNALYFVVNNFDAATSFLVPNYLLFSARIEIRNLIIVNTDTGTVDGDGDGDSHAFHGVPFTYGASPTIGSFILHGDLTLGDADLVRVVGSRTLSITSPNNVTMGTGTIWDASGTDTAPGPGGGAGGAGQNGALRGLAGTGASNGAVAFGGTGGAPISCLYANGGDGLQGDTAPVASSAANGGFGQPGSPGGDGTTGVNLASGGAGGAGGQPGTTIGQYGSGGLAGGRGEIHVGGLGGGGGYTSGGNGSRGVDGGNGSNGRDGIVGPSGLPGSGGTNVRNDDVLTAGSGGGAGGSGGGGGGGGGGGAGGNGSGGGGGGATSCVYGGSGGAGGKGASSLPGGDGGNGGAGGRGGHGGGGVEIIAWGRFLAIGSFSAHGGNGQPGASGAAGSAGRASQGGDAGSPGNGGSAGSGDGGPGGDGGSSGAGGTGGTGGAGGTGGGGAGGTVKLIASVLNDPVINVDVQGGGGDNPGGLGRVILAANNGYYAPGNPAQFTMHPTGILRQTPYVPSAGQAPPIPELVDGAETFGLTTLTLADFPDVATAAPSGAAAAVVRMVDGKRNYSDLLTGFDKVFLVNLGNDPLGQPAFLSGASGQPVPLLLGGWVRDQQFGGAGSVPLDALGANQVYALTIPAQDAPATFQATVGGRAVSVTGILQRNQPLYLVTGKHTIADALRALGIAGGLVTADAADLLLLKVTSGPPSGITVGDAIRLTRQAAGLDPNP